jgi:hypothetical protein
MELLLADIRAHFSTLENRLRVFAQQEVQLEGWFKGECLFLLQELKSEGCIRDVNREVATGLGKRKIDITVDLRGQRHWVELKHWHIGPQKGACWGPKDYIDSLEDEYQKFEAVRANGRAWVLAFCTPNPGADLWKEALRYFNCEYSPWKLKAKTDPVDYPRTFFIGLFACGGLRA